jgi:hypothetical protein
MSEGAMTNPIAPRRRWSASAASLALLLLLGMSACGLDDVDIPPLIGPSELGLSVQLTVSPDTLNADGVSQSVVRLMARDQNGKPAPGRQILFQHDGDGFLVAGSLVVGPLQSGLSLATDSGGVAQVVYVAGTDFRTVTIFVRPYSFDGTVIDFSRTVRILQR